MLSLILHAAHNNEGKDVVESEVATRLDLMLEKFHVNLSLEFVLILMVADENRSGE